MRQCAGAAPPARSCHSCSQSNERCTRRKVIEERSGVRFAQAELRFGHSAKRSLIKLHALRALWNCLLTLIADGLKTPLSVCAISMLTASKASVLHFFCNLEQVDIPAISLAASHLISVYPWHGPTTCFAWLVRKPVLDAHYSVCSKDGLPSLTCSLQASLLVGKSH